MPRGQRRPGSPGQRLFVAMVDAYIAQGWVPPTCTLTKFQALALWPVVQAGADPCVGCYHDRAICHGRRTPKNRKPQRRPDE